MKTTLIIEAILANMIVFLFVQGYVHVGGGCLGWGVVESVMQHESTACTLFDYINLNQEAHS